MSSPTRWLLALAAMLHVHSQADEAWTQFRGPRGNGVSDSTGTPLVWSETQNVRWKTPIHGRGWSSPVVHGNQVWLTTATEDGTRLSVLCLDRETGKILHDEVLHEVAEPQFAHRFNSYASPTPCIEEGRVYVTFGSPGTTCIDTKTFKKVWQRTDFVCNHFRGAGSSPVPYGNFILMHFDGSDHQYIAALDKENGQTRWITERSIDFQDLMPNGLPDKEGDMRKCFATPTIVSVQGTNQIISIGSYATYGYEADTGRELWRTEHRKDHSSGLRPVMGDGLAFISTGYSRGRILALDPANQGRIVWEERKGVPKKPSLIFNEGLLFIVDDGGIASCFEAATGKNLWQERVGGNHSASPLLVEGRIWCFDENGKATAFAASREFKIIQENKLEEGFMASPAVAGQALYLRTKTHMYRIEAR